LADWLSFEFELGRIEDGEGFGSAKILQLRLLVAYADPRLSFSMARRSRSADDPVQERTMSESDLDK
jgi:hypothetical protein